VEECIVPWPCNVLRVWTRTLRSAWTRSMKWTG